MPNSDFAEALARMFARMAESGIASISPAPNNGVGMRKVRFGFPPWPVNGLPAGTNVGWSMLQPTASLRPVMVNNACTSPSGVPLELRLKRVSRMGPLAVINQGTAFLAPLRVAIVIRGFAAGLVPPPAGWE